MIDLTKLSDDDRGRIVKVYEEELGSFQKVVLVNWNEKFLYLRVEE